MDDLRTRLRALDRIAVPDQWPEIERRSWAPSGQSPTPAATPTPAPALSPRTRWLGGGSGDPSRRSRPVLMLTPLRVLAVGLVAALSTGLLAVTLSGPTPTPPTAPGAASPSAGVVREGGPAVDWDTHCVTLAADWLRILPDAAGDDPDLIFTADTDVVALNSDPGNETYRTLEATWFESGSEMRVNLYFKADTEHWWVSELRTYDGQPTPDWITFPGPLFETPLGEVYNGDVLLNGGQGHVPGTVEIGNLRLSIPDFGPGSDEARCTSTGPVRNGVSISQVTEASPSAGVSPAAEVTGETKEPDALSPAVIAALEAVSAELLARCYGREEGVARLSAALVEAGESGFYVRTDGPIGGPDDRIDEITAHVHAGCVIYGGSGSTGDGIPVFYIGGGSGQPTSTFVPGTAAG